MPHADCILEKDWDNWKPTADNINALPDKLKEYVCGLETLCDPQYIIAENIFLKDEMFMFIESLKIKDKENCMKKDCSTCRHYFNEHLERSISRFCYGCTSKSINWAKKLKKVMKEEIKLGSVEVQQGFSRVDCMNVKELIERRQFKIVVLCDLMAYDGHSIVAPCLVKDEYVVNRDILCIEYHGDYYNTVVLYTYLDEPRATWNAIVVHDKFPTIKRGDPIPLLIGYEMELIKEQTV